MRAGLLKDKIDIEEMVTETTPTGAPEKHWQKIITTRCRRQKLTAVVGDGLNAYEEFIQNTVILQVRYRKEIKEEQRVVYGGRRFRITLVNKQSDNTLLLTCEKINE